MMVTVKEEADVMVQMRSNIGAKPEESIYDDGGGWLRGPMLGEGGFGAVHLAFFPNPAVSARFEGFPSLVAVKSSCASSQKELETERMLYGCLGESPFVIRCFGDDVTVAEDGGLLLNVFLEYASGETLYDLIQTTEGLLESQARVLTRSILGGIRHIHEAGFVHCDLKPENVLLVEDDEGFGAKIGDLGLAKSVEDNEGFVQGTEMYLSPESVKQGIQGQASDIWALGCIVYAMLTGRLEWDGAPRIQRMTKRSSNTDESQDPQSAIFSQEAEDFLRKCLSRNPSDRPTAAMLLSHPFVSGSEVQQEDRDEARQSKDKEMSCTSDTGGEDSPSFMPLALSTCKEDEEEQESDAREEDGFNQVRTTPVAIMDPRPAKPVIASTFGTKGFVTMGAA